VDHALHARLATMTRRALVAVVLVSCTAKTISPPLSSTFTARTFDGVLLTSGRFEQPHRVTGVIQLTQDGYKLFHELEVVEDANPSSLLFKIGSYARSLGADGVQHLELIDLDPQTPAETAGKQMNSAVRIHRDVKRGKPATIVGEGTKTRWEVRGELVRFQKGAR
jgi:hypothetical protein